MPHSTTILVIDAGRSITEIITTILRNEGYTVFVARDYAHTLAFISGRLPALILIDHTQSLLSEGSIQALIRNQHETDVPIITMAPKTISIAPSTAHPHQAWLLKPFTRDDLLTCVARYVQLPRHESHDRPRNLGPYAQSFQALPRKTDQ